MSTWKLILIVLVLVVFLSLTGTISNKKNDAMVAASAQSAAQDRSVGVVVPVPNDAVMQETSQPSVVLTQTEMPTADSGTSDTQSVVYEVEVEAVETTDADVAAEDTSRFWTLSDEEIVQYIPEFAVPGAAPSGY